VAARLAQEGDMVSAQMASAQDDILKELGEYISGKLGPAVTAMKVAHGELTLTVQREQILKVLKLLRDDGRCRFEVLIDLCGVDWPQRSERFDVVYHLLSPRTNQRIRVKTSTDDATPVPSANDVFSAANWYEREAYDMFGILFSGHPDLRRLLTDYGFQGHPLRKDFPLTGYVEVRYDDEKKRVVYEPVKLTQEFRAFDFESPWEGGGAVLPGDEKASATPPGKE
jgi:NADH-quinone oxidoreductase subunit C